MVLQYNLYKKDEMSEWIVFIHGIGSSSNTWVRQVKAFKQDYNLLLIDLHGHGRSKNSTLKNNPSFEQINNDIIKVLDGLNIESAHFMGISLGTVIVNSLTLTHPDRVKSTIMAGAILNISLKLRILLKFILLFKLTYSRWVHDIAFKVIFPMKKDKNTMESFSNNLKRSDKNNLHYWATLINSANDLFIKKDYSKTPTLFIMGEEDKLLIKSIIENVEGAALFIIPNATHLCHLDSSTLFNSVVLNFLKNKNYTNIKVREKIDFSEKLTASVNYFPHSNAHLGRS